MKGFIFAFIFISLNCLYPIAFATSSIPVTQTNRGIITGSNILDLNDLIKNGMQLAVRNPRTGVISYTSSGIFLKRDGYFYQDNLRLQGFPFPDKLTSVTFPISKIAVYAN